MKNCGIKIHLNNDGKLRFEYDDFESLDYIPISLGEIRNTIGQSSYIKVNFYKTTKTTVKKALSDILVHEYGLPQDAFEELYNYLNHLLLNLKEEHPLFKNLDNNYII